MMSMRKRVISGTLEAALALTGFAGLTVPAMAAVGNGSYINTVLKGIRMSKGQLRIAAAAGVLSVVLGLGACSMPGSGNADSSNGGSSSSSASSSYEAELKQALQSASSDFERGVLERAVKVGKISESDYREANEKYQECMAAKGDDVEFDTDQSTGLMQEHMNTDDNYDSAKANEDSMACAKGTNLQIRDLYERMVQNPSNADEIELIVGCLKRRKLVPDSFTKQDYLTEMGKPEGTSKLDTSSDAFSQCLANPSK